MIRVRGLALACAVGGSAFGCSGTRPPPPNVVARPPAPEVAAGYGGPARWDYHPPAAVTALATVKQPDGGCVITAEGGQRWLSSASKLSGSRLLCSGSAVASFAVAAEDLSSALRRADGSWLYVGESGTLYEAADPLGAFTRTVPAPEPLAKVAGAGAGVLAATLEGKVLRWDATGGWRPVPPSPALAGARIFDVAATESGRALALAFPEGLFASEDGGQTWRAAGAPAVGARRLGTTSSGELGAQGLFESVVWRGADFVRGPDKIVPTAATLAVDVGSAPSASAVQTFRAVLEGDRYYEAVRPEKEGDAWTLSRGHLEGRLETVPLPGSERCGNVRLGARGAVVFLACLVADDAYVVAEVRKSTDAGSTWGEPLRLATPDTDQITISVSPAGNALLAGACKASEGASCKPSAPILVRAAAAEGDAGAAADAGAPVTMGGTPKPPAGLHGFPASAPQLNGAAVHPTFAADGRSAYFLGKRGKDDRTGLFVSHDGGETFSPRVLQPTGIVHPPRPSSEEEQTDSSEPGETFELDEGTPPHPGDDGTVGLMVLRSRGSYAYLTTDEDGRLLQVAGPPLDDDGASLDVVMAGHGRRLLAVPSYLPNDGTSGSLWESLDSGLSWDKEPMPQALVREYSRGNIALVCGAAGCLLGDTVARVGWGAAGEPGPADRPPDQPAEPTRDVRTPLVCDLSAGSRWARVDDVYLGEGAQGPMPTVSVAMRGRSVWSVLTMDRATGALASVSATLPESGEGEARIVRRPLLGARGPHTATAVSATQVEGYAMARVSFTPDAQGKPKPGTPLRDLELSWESFPEGLAGHARVPDAGTLQSGDITIGPGGVALLRPGMVSITSRGLFLRIHAAHAEGGEEIFVDPKGRVERYPTLPWPKSGPLGPLDVRVDAAAVQGELFSLGLVQDADEEWSSLSLARRAPGGAIAYSAFSLVPPRKNNVPLVDTSWSSSAKAPVGVTAVVADPAHGRAWAHFIGFRKDGTFSPAEPMATLADLGDRPRACTAADRSGAPRGVSHLKLHGNVYFPGARHPVLVFEPRAKNAVGVAEPQVLVTSSAVVEGPPSSPCLAAFEADSVVRGAPLGALIPGDISRSWLFRLTEAPRPGPAGRTPTAPNGDAETALALEYRPMACRYDPSAPIPDVVWTQEGTTRP